MSPSEPPSTATGDIHRIGGGGVDNLRLKPGISVLKAPTPGEAARQIREAFPAARALGEAARVVGSTTVEKIRAAGFDIIADPTKRFPNHHRIVHPDGTSGFDDEHLRKLSDAFSNTSGH